MRMKRIEVKNIPPIKQFQVDNLSDVVVLAGPNGVGKTRLVQGILNFLQSPQPKTDINLVIEATCNEERNEWEKGELDTNIPEDTVKLKNTLQRSQRRVLWRSSIINFESNRSVQKIAPFSFSFDTPDPWEEQINWDVTFHGLQSRFQDTVNSIFKKVQNRRELISRKAESRMKGGKKYLHLKFPDPTLPFKDAFNQLLPPKQLVDPEPRKQQLYYEEDGAEFAITSLSSGEAEVVNIVFDFLLRSPSDSIVLFDEPELHLHPELNYKLYRTLRTVGTNNQFIFCTHSPDLITASLENSVVFIAPATSESKNQAIVVKEDDKTHQALKMLGQSIGIIALGKKIVLIEGNNSSLDKQTYGLILKDRFPNLVLVPSGGKSIITSFSTLCDQVLDRSLWGVDFFMLCDHDAIPPAGAAKEIESHSNGRLKVLQRYHIENYFLDEYILENIFSPMESSESWLASKETIRNKLREIAKDNVSYAVALSVSAIYREQLGNLDIMPKDCFGKTKSDLTQLIKQSVNKEQKRFSKLIDIDNIVASTEQIYDSIHSSIDEDTDYWKQMLPGRQLLNRFADAAKLDVGRLKLLYSKEVLKTKPRVFQDIIDIFEHFSTYMPHHQ